MSDVTLRTPSTEDIQLVRLAREIAMDVNPLETILKTNGIDSNRWETIKTSHRFNQLLEAEVAAWNSALNTAERTKLKAGAMIEEWLGEAYAQMNDRAQTLPAKTELAKLIARIAGVGTTGVGVDGTGSERFSLTINLGQDRQLTINKEISPRVIEAEVVKSDAQ